MVLDFTDMSVLEREVMQRTDLGGSTCEMFDPNTSTYWLKPEGGDSEEEVSWQYFAREQTQRLEDNTTIKEILVGPIKPNSADEKNLEETTVESAKNLFLSGGMQLLPEYTLIQHFDSNGKLELEQLYAHYGEELESKILAKTAKYTCWEQKRKEATVKDTVLSYSVTITTDENTQCQTQTVSREDVTEISTYNRSGKCVRTQIEQPATNLNLILDGKERELSFNLGKECRRVKLDNEDFTNLTFAMTNYRAGQSVLCETYTIIGNRGGCTQPSYTFKFKQPPVEVTITEKPITGYF